MKLIQCFLIGATLLGAAVLIGCGDDVPRQPMPADGSNPHVNGSPEERIKNLQQDPSLSAEEKERRIGIIKQRNNIK